MARIRTMFGTPAQLVCACLAGLCLSLCTVSDSLAGVDVCQQPTGFSHLSLAHYFHEKSALHRGLGDLRQRHNEIDLLFRPSDQWAVGAGHRYTILDIETLELQSNGHLHTFFLPLHRETGSDSKRFRLSIAPALSASSNVIKDPDEYNADAFQLLVGLVWSRQAPGRAMIRYGICSDHRFGNFKTYPLVSVDLRPDPDWTITLGFPTSQLNYRVSKNLTSSLKIAPDGNEWLVKDKSLEKQSNVVHEAWLFEWTFSWLMHENFIVNATVGKQFRNRYAMTLLNDDRVNLHTGPVIRLGAALTWRF